MRRTTKLTGAGARSAECTNTGHENAEGMAFFGVRVERTVRLRRAGEGVENTMVRIDGDANAITWILVMALPPVAI